MHSISSAPRMDGSRDRDGGRGRARADEDRRSSAGSERNSRRKGNGEDSEDHRDRRRPSKNPTRDHHRRHLEKLMEHPDRPVSIPAPSKDRKPPDPPEFMRFYMGSSAGAGSEVFHVYRHLRRRENERQDYISTKATEEALEDDFQQTIAMYRSDDNARTAKKRAKRLKRKQRQKLAKKMAKGESAGQEETKTAEQDSSSEGGEEEEQHFTIGGK